MKLKHIVLLAIAALLFFGVLVPGAWYRYNFEQSTKTYVAAVDVTRLEEFFDDTQITEVLKQYQDAGCTTAVFTEQKGVYNEKNIAIADMLGLYIALAPDVTVKDDAEIDELCQKYNVKYIKLQKSIWKDKTEAEGKSEPVCDAIKEHRLTLVLTETIWQLANEEPRDYEDYLHAADGRMLRTFNTYHKTNVDNTEYPVGYYQMYNSAYERNTRFITVKQLEDEGYDVYENAERTRQNVKLFCQKMDSHGFVKEGTVNYSGYKPSSRVIFAAAAALAVIMLVFVLLILFGTAIKHIEVMGVIGAIAAFAVSFGMPDGLLRFYPTLFAVFAACFCITVCAAFVDRTGKRLKFVPLLLLSAVVAVLLFFGCGTVMSAMLSGADYFLNNKIFSGVKLTLIAPILYTAVLIFAKSYKKRTLQDYKEMVRGVIRQIRWYHIAILCVLLALGALYVIRSGNVNKISFVEVYMRNLLTELFAARPRTKEFLIGWPCFALYVFYAKYGKFKLIKWAAALGASILFASSINTFCHVFTMTHTMYMRVVFGLLFGIVISAAALGVNALLLKLISRKNRTTTR